MHAFFGGGLRFSRRASSFSLGFCAGAQFVRQQMLESGLPKKALVHVTRAVRRFGPTLQSSGASAEGTDDGPGRRIWGTVNRVSSAAGVLPPFTGYSGKTSVRD